MTSLDEVEVSRRQEEDGADHIGGPNQHVLLKPVERRKHGVERVEVEQDRADEL